MNGLLHRLAARAAGTAALVRSDARLPFGDGMEFGRPEAAESEGDWPNAQVPPPGAGSRRQADGGPAATLPAPAAAAPGTPLPEPMLAASSSPAVVSLPAAQATARLDASRPDGMAAASVVQGAPPAPGPAAPPPEHGPGESVAGTATPAARPADTSPAGESHAHRMSPRLMPSRLMPPTPRAMVATSALPAALAPVQPSLPLPVGAQPTVPPATTAESAEVHIHIGRIEVTAAQEAAPPRLRPAAPAPAPSLDDYLAKRSPS